MKYPRRVQRGEWVDMLTTSKTKKTTFSRSSILAYLKRVSKRAKQAAGEDVDPGSFWSYDFVADGVRYTGRVYANTRSEARGMMKKLYSLKRIPVGAKIVNKGKSPKPSKDVQ